MKYQFLTIVQSVRNYGRRRAAPTPAPVVLGARTGFHRMQGTVGNQTHTETGGPDGSRSENIVHAVTASGRTLHHRRRVRGRREKIQKSFPHTHSLLRSSGKGNRVLIVFTTNGYSHHMSLSYWYLLCHHVSSTSQLTGHTYLPYLLRGRETSDTESWDREHGCSVHVIERHVTGPQGRTQENIFRGFSVL